MVLHRRRPGETVAQEQKRLKPKKPHKGAKKGRKS